MARPVLAYSTAEHRLRAYGVDLSRGGIACDISWFGRSPEGVEVVGYPGSETAIQALTGLMHLHRTHDGRPRRLGIDVASVAAGVLATHAVLAGRIAEQRGLRGRPVATSVVNAGLLQGAHYFAAATCPEEWVPAAPGPAPGPPFPTSDGQWFEIETFDTEAWRAFWSKLGGGDLELGRAWTVFRSRYYRGVCPMPAGFHEAAATHTLAEVADAAAACSISFVPVRSCAEALADPGIQARHPVLSPMPGEGAPSRAAAGLGRAGPDAGLPLRGIAMVESTTRMQGPLAGLLLRWLGADVVKVEPPGGDVGRGVPPLAGDTGSFYLCMNRGKQAVEVDLATPSGRRDLLDLVGDADVFLHNWRPGKAAEWRLDAPSMAARNPQLVYALASGWGNRPAMDSVIGTDFLVQAYCGIGASLNPVDMPPAPSRVLLTDFMGALVAAEGILGALYQRGLDGQGRVVDTSLLAGGMTLQSAVLEAMASGRIDGRDGGRPVFGPADRPVLTEGGSWVVPAGGVDVPVTTDLAELSRSREWGGLFEPLAADALAPSSPWRFAP